MKLLRSKSGTFHLPKDIFQTRCGKYIPEIEVEEVETDWEKLEPTQQCWTCERLRRIELANPTANAVKTRGDIRHEKELEKFRAWANGEAKR